MLHFPKVFRRAQRQPQVDSDPATGANDDVPTERTLPMPFRDRDQDFFDLPERARVEIEVMATCLAQLGRLQDEDRQAFALLWCVHQLEIENTFNHCVEKHRAP